jgi:hypothetical protein
MKRVILISSAVVIGSLVAFSFTSCKKKEGTYKTKDKLWKVYTETYFMSSAGEKIYGYPDNQKTLVEVWRWDKNKLMQVEHPGGWSANFVYKGNQVQSIESGSNVYTLTYDDKKTKLKKIEGVDMKKRTFYVLTIIDRNEDKITRFSIDLTIYYDDPDEKSVAKMQPIISVLMGGNIGEIVAKNMEKSVKHHKASSINKYKYEYELTYEGNNASQAKLTTTITMENNSPITDVTITKYKYDSKVNPLYNAHHVALGLAYSSFSENNIVSRFQYELSDIKFEKAIDSAMYVYQYNTNGVPTQKDELTEKQNPDGLLHSIIHYEYVTK